MSKASEAPAGAGACLDGGARGRRRSALAPSPRPRRRCRPTSGASSRRRRRAPNSSSACSAGGVDSVRIPIDWSAVQPSQGGAFDWTGVDALVERRRAAPASRCCPFLSGAPTWAVPAARSPAPAARKAPTTCRSRPAPQRAGWTTFLDASGRPLRPERQLLGRATRRAETADPHLADLERAELQVLRRQAQPGRIRQAGEALLHGDQGRRPGRQGDPRRPLRAAEEAPNRKRQAASSAYFATDFLEQMYKTTPGIKSQVQRRRPAPLHRRLPAN